ncbi:MAG: S41 family peptidase [Chloroflexota bacterium]|nr:S41 family peptidase [Chloroflexota bacterium]
MTRDDHSGRPGRYSVIGGHGQRFVVAVLMTLSFTLGMGVDRFTANDADATTTLTEEPEFEILEQTWDLIQNEYVALDEIEQEEIFYGAASGMVDALGDTGHSRYMNPDEAESFNRSSEGEFVGIGIQMDYSTGQPVVAYPIDGSPADKAGIRSGDVIVAVDGTETEGMSQVEIQDLLVGEEGEAVDLVIYRPNTDETLEFNIVRARIEIQGVSWSLMPNNIALIRIVQFQTGVTNELKAAIRAARREGVEAIILDLRDNPGGLVFEAIGVASQFIEEGSAIYLYEERDLDPRPVNTVPGGLATDMPMVVLINEGSASAAEITASALMDNDRAVSVGETTFGTGTVLTPFELEDGSIVLLGTALWLRGNGDPIWKVGLPPTIEVELPADADQLRASEDEEITAVELDESTDVQLQRAFEEMTALLSGSGAQ